jgi:hypothetical protein
MKFVWTVLMVVVVVVSAWTFLAAQSGPVAGTPKIATPFVAAPAAPVPAAIPGRSPARARGFDRDANRPMTPLQQRYLELSKKKARLMTEEQLQQAIDEMNRELEEAHAWAKVEESARLLQQVIESHPRSKAADTARAALKLIQENRASNMPAPAVPNPGPSNSSPFNSGAFKRSPLIQERIEKRVTS